MLITLLFFLTTLQLDHLGDYFIEGHYRDVKIVDSCAYFGTGMGFEIYDYTDPTDPQLISRAATYGIATGIDVVGNYVYIADLYNGLCIFDISDPLNPVLTGHYNTGGFTEYVRVKDSLAYLADGDSGLVILDVSDPFNPRYLGAWAQSNYYAFAVFVADTIAYLGCATYRNPLKIINVADPTNPYLIANFPQNPDPYDIIDHAYIVDTLAYLAGTMVMSNELYNFIIANVADPANPVLVSVLDLDEPARRVVVRGDYAYVNAQAEGIYIIDISDPEMPVVVNYFDETIGFGYGLAVCDSILIATHYNQGFSIVDVSNPINLVKLYYKPNFNWRGFLIDDNLRYLYLLGHIMTGAGMYPIFHTALKFIDINDIINPIVRSELHFLGVLNPSYTAGLGLVTEYPYLGFGISRLNDDYLGIVDVSDIDHPQLFRFVTGTLSSPSAMISSKIYAGHYSTLKIGDIFAEPFWVDSLDTPEGCYTVAIDDSIAYAACVNNLAILNLNTGSLIATYYHNHFYGGRNGIILDFPYLYMSYSEITGYHEYAFGFLIFDVSNASAPLLLADTMMLESVPPYSWYSTISCYLYDTLFFLCRASQGFAIWNVSDPTSVDIVFQQDTPYSCADIYVLDDTVFVMDGKSIQMYRLTDTGIDEAYYLDVAGRVSFIDVYPNPFKQMTTIKFQVPTLNQVQGKSQINSNPAQADQITLKIYDVSGRLVKDFSHLTLDAQRPTLLSWDGTANDGKELAQGIYFIKLKVEGTSYTKKVILLK